MKYLKIVLALIVILGIAIGLYSYFSTKSDLPTYFTYNKDELKSLKQIKSSYSMSQDTLKKWDEVMFDLVKTHKLGDVPASRIYAYLFTAQRDAAFLSYNAKHQFMGSLDPISAEVLVLFFPEDATRIKAQLKTDDYSNKLAALVISKVILRMEEDKKREKLSPEKIGPEYWVGVRPYFGQEAASWKTWVIKSPQDFPVKVPPKPDSEEWQKQLLKTETALKNITPEQTKAVVFWAGNPSTVTPPGIWIKFANEYMDSQDTPLKNRLFIRSVLAMGIADVVITMFDAKYIYWIRRPFMLNPKLQTVMPTPNHPSYPAGHASISGTAAAILSYYFPQNQKTWWEQANQASMSRVWGGIHFPIDVENGLNLGDTVGRAVIKAQPNMNMD